MSRAEVKLVERGIDAWRRGDFAAVQDLLDASATWRGFEPGEWDCETPDEILRTLRERHEQGFAAGRTELVDAGAGSVVLVSWPREVGGDEWPEETATVVAVSGGKVVSMRDYRTRGEALASIHA